MNKFEEITAARTILGLGETATLKEIKQAYQQMALRHHPDKQQDETNDPPDEEIKPGIQVTYGPLPPMQMLLQGGRHRQSLSL